MSSPLINSEPIVSNKGRVPCADDSDEVAKVTVGSLVKTGIVQTTTDLNPGGAPGAAADAVVKDTTITLGAAIIKATVLESHAAVSCGPTGPVFTGSSKVVGLNINGQQINIIDQPVTIPANPLVVVSINEQTTTADSITQRALHVQSALLMTDIVIAEAIADVHGNPCPPAPKPECSDDIDNADPEDTLADEQDPGCHTDGDPNNPATYDPNDNDETDVVKPECSDGVDNADPEDTVADEQDPGCHTDGDPNNPATYDPNDNDETDVVKPECSDGVDNADPEDTVADEQDPGCHTDGDPNNPGTYDPNDNDETDVPKKQCSDDVDNDDDKLTDEQDPGCHTDSNPDNPDSYDPNDDDESDK